MLTYYLSGPMRGLPNDNYDTFNDVERALPSWLSSDGQGHDFHILNPARNFGGDRTRQITEYMQADLDMLLQSDVIVLLPGWENSEGAAQREVPVALWTGKSFLRAIQDAHAPRGWRFEQMAPPIPAEEPVPEPPLPAASVRTFDGGATRDTDDGKLDYEGFLSPAVVKAFAQYMHGHRIQSDGSLRAADNWQKGMPVEVYMSSMFRHFMDVWQNHRGIQTGVDQLEALMAMLFNVQGYAFELLREAK